MKNRLLSLVFFGLSLLFLIACSGNNEEKKDELCVDELPECADPTPVCVGQYGRTCNEDKTGFEYTYCRHQVCRDGACLAPACTTPGEAYCEDTMTARYCLDTMVQLATRSCEAGTACAGGSCLAVPCTPGDKVCTWKSISQCTEDGNAWLVTPCGDGTEGAADEYCDPAGPTCVAKEPFCISNPLGSFCRDIKTPVTCDIDGKSSTGTCADDEVCLRGFCQKAICGVEYQPSVKDVVGEDGGLEDTAGPMDLVSEDTLPDTVQVDIPPLEQPPLAQVVINGGEFVDETITFNVNRQAQYVQQQATDDTSELTALQIRMGRGTLLMEIWLQDLGEGVTGTFTAGDDSGVVGMIFFNDGSPLEGDLQWKYLADSYEVVLEEFGPAQTGTVKGTFSGTLKDQMGGPDLVLTEGVFRVPRK